MQYDPKEQSRFQTLTENLLANIPLEKTSYLDPLKEALRYHEWRYYILNEPILSDADYDVLFNQLKNLEKKYPLFVTNDSPTQRVSHDIVGDLPGVEHRISMLSLDNAYTPEDLYKFDEQVHKLTKVDVAAPISYTVEPKLDGGSVALLYVNDQFVRGATRGNGQTGEEITANMRMLRSVPLRALFSKMGIYEAELRGEAVIHKETFKKVNLQREESGLSTFANPRNAAAGGLRMKVPQETSERGVEFFAFQLGYAVDEQGLPKLNDIPTHQEQLQLLAQLGFKAHTQDLVCHNIDEVIGLIHKWSKIREEYPYEIDGMVVKVNDLLLQEKCGATQHHPRWAIAYKFKAKQATTTLQSVEYQVGKTGTITPVAKVEPIHLAGVTVSSISLHNEEFISSKDLRIGDKVIIERAGDVIPYIVKSLPEWRTGSESIISFPITCPSDPMGKATLVREKNESAWRCKECTCGAQMLQKIIFHVSKDGMDIDGFGKSFVERFYELGWIKNVADIYDLDYSLISHLEGFGEKSAENLRSSIERAKQNPIHSLLASLAIHHLGKKASKLLAAEVEHVLDLASWTEQDFIAIKDIGPVLAKNVREYFSHTDNITLLKRMESLGVNMQQTEEDKTKIIQQDAPLANKTILFTGTLTKMGREKAIEIAEKAGAKSLSAVSSKLDILVVGENAGSKLQKAQSIGTVTIMTEDEFLEIVRQKNSIFVS